MPENRGPRNLRASSPPVGAREGRWHPQPQREVEAGPSRNGPAVRLSPRHRRSRETRGVRRDHSRPPGRGVMMDAPWQRRGGADSLSGRSGSAVLIVLAAVLGPYIYIHFIEGPAPAKLELPKASTSTTAGSFEGICIDVVVARWQLERGRRLHGRLPRARGPRRPERDRGRSHQQDLGLAGDRRVRP